MTPSQTTSNSRARASRKKRKAAELKPEAVKVQPEAVKTSGAQPKILEKGVDTAAIGDTSQKDGPNTSAGFDTARQVPAGSDSALHDSTGVDTVVKVELPKVLLNEKLPIPTKFKTPMGRRVRRGR